MPGRDELIQNNIARAQAGSQETSPRDSLGQSSLSSGSAPKSFLGGNYDVYSQLESIQFQGALGDASMRGNVAYIRLWKRGGTVGQSPASQGLSGTDLGESDFWSNLSSSIGETFGSLPTSLKNEYAFDPSSSAAFGYTFKESETFPQLLSLPGDSLIARQTSLASSIPVSGFFDSSGVNFNVETFSQAPSAVEKQQTNTLGAVKSANPNGFISTLNRVGRAIIGLPSGRISNLSQANAARLDASTIPLGEMMWQFLFNPSEMELEVGPEFKNSETWGVSDKSNSGQPLHWSHNKNAVLKFNSILLNGFVFGRKVEVLEQGIIELFMARDGEGQHGPHVLEFVWGKRVFGPCVIKNINIKEKMWDEGEVVNAEISFTLEQVPEWTINDGFVDVARPGRLSTEGSPAVSGSSAANPAGATNPTGGNANPGGGQKPDQKARVTPSGPSAQFCTQATNAYSNFNNLGGKSNKSWTDNVFGTPEARATQLGNEYTTILNANRSVTGTLGAIDSKCSKGCPQTAYYYPNTATLNVNAYLGCVQSCSYQYASKINGSYFDNVRCAKPQFVRPL